MKKLIAIGLTAVLSFSVIGVCAQEITGTVTVIEDTTDFGEYDYIDAYIEGFAYVEKDGKCGFINESGDLIVPCIYDKALYFSQGYAKVCLDDKWGYVDTTGEVVIPLMYDWAISFDESGYAAVKKGEKWGYIDKKNNVVIDFIYDEAGNFEKGIAVVLQKDKWGSIDVDNNVVIDFASDTKEAAYDERGKVIFPAQYANFDDGDMLPKLAIAKPTSATVLVNGKEIKFDAYEIAGYNFFKLRDLATVVSGTQKQFEVVWNESDNRIDLISDKPYTPVGGELSVGGKEATVSATMSTSSLTVDDYVIGLVAYNINDNNYFKLRDVAKAFNIGVTWDDATQTIGIDTTIGYEE
ncbi:MAG: WG repeat-containing protein [Eubacteriales bacterium]|nr:WG repeat-containing protein [Eubacteriales bacterium]